MAANTACFISSRYRLLSIAGTTLAKRRPYSGLSTFVNSVTTLNAADTIDSPDTTKLSCTVIKFTGRRRVRQSYHTMYFKHYYVTVCAHI